MAAERRTKTVRRARRDQMNDLYRTWAQNRWPAGLPETPDWNDVETAFQAGFHLALTEGAHGVLGMDTERLCWALRQFVKMVPAGDECRVQLKVGSQSFFIGMESMPEDEAAQFAGLFVFALAGMVQQIAPGVEPSCQQANSQQTPTAKER